MVVYNRDILLDKRNLAGTSYDWLMPVIKKLDELPVKWMRVKTLREYVKKCDYLDDVVTQYEIRDTFEATVDFVKWYNKFIKPYKTLTSNE